MNELTNRQVLTFDPFKANADEADREFKALEACLLGIASSAQDMIKKGGER